MTERPLTAWEREVMEVLAGVDGDRATVVRESIPHLVWTGGCECGCASFTVRDERYPPQPHQLSHYSNGVSRSEPAVGFCLWTGPDGRPLSVDVDNQPGQLPDTTAIVVTLPGA
jgi:hypothetical protein